MLKAWFCDCGTISVVGGRFAIVERGSSSMKVKVLPVLCFFNGGTHFLALLGNWCCSRYVILYIRT